MGTAIPPFGALSPFLRPAPSNLHSLAACDLLGTPSLAPHWIFVRPRFKAFLDNLAITSAQREDGETKQAGVRACLNRHFYGYSSDTANSLLIGSWGKTTRVRPSRDVDILFLLPDAVYWRYQQRSGNRQSDLLQEVKNVLLVTYPQTSMRGDGQVILIPFNQTPVEVAPGFRCTDGNILVCDTNDGGSYKVSTAQAEESALSASDAHCVGNTRALARMLKQWQREHNVPLKSFQLERLAIEFLANWPNNQRDHFWYDWMVRDFFAFLIGRSNKFIYMPGTGEAVWLGGEWLFKAQSAYRHSLTACDYEYDNHEALAGREWQSIFGNSIPSRTS
jgi:Second Messenger Oligonucleotide or Dinucleotide Synthetase domain